MSSPECSFVKVVNSCVATACPKILPRDKMNMECCPVKKEEKKSEHTCGGKVSLQLNSKRRIKGRHQRSGGAREVAGPNGEGARGKKTVIHTVPCCNQKATMQPPLKDTFCDARKKVESHRSICKCKLKKQLHGDTDWKDCFEFRAIFQGQRNRQVLHREKI